MSEREIKVGSKWRHVQAVMTEWRAIKAKMGVE